MRCPRTPFDMVASEAPEVRFPASCRTWGCVYCGPRKAALRAKVLAWAKPERFITLTLAPHNWQACRQKVRRLALDVRRAGYAWEVAWTVEAGKKSGMRHVHLLQHGSYVPQRWLQTTWGAIVDIRKISVPKGAADYMLKEAERMARYPLKGMADLEDHLRLNGGRGYHASRHYLRGKRVADVEKLVLAGTNNGVPYTWVLVPWDAPGP